MPRRSYADLSGRQTREAQMYQRNSPDFLFSFKQQDKRFLSENGKDQVSKYLCEQRQLDAYSTRLRGKIDSEINNRHR